jgi:hypothetical protein
MPSALRQGLELAAKQNEQRPDIDPEQNVVGGVDIGQATKGWRSSMWGMGANLRQTVGGAAEAMGATDFAQDQYTAAEQTLRDAAVRGPRISSFDQLQKEGFSLRNTGDYLAGMVGSTAASALPAIGAGALASTPLGALAAGTAAYIPIETGDVIGRMRERTGNAPITGRDFGQALGTGTASSVAQAVPGVIVGGKIAGRAIGNVVGGAPTAMTLKQAAARNLWEVPAESLSETAGTAIKQLGSGQGIDTAELKEAAIGGAVGGGMMSGVGTGADYLRGNASGFADSVRNVADKGRQFLPGQPPSPGGGGAGAVEGVNPPSGGPSASAWGKVATMGKNALEGVSESDLGKSITERTANARQRVEAILADTEIPAQIRDNVRNGLNNLGDKTYQAYVASVDKVRQVQAKAREEGVRKAFTDEVRGVVDKLQNGDFLGNAREMAGATGERASELLKASGERAADLTRRMGEDLMSRVNPETRAKIEAALQNTGDRANQAFIASKWKAQDAWEATKAKAGELKARFDESARRRKKADVDGESRWVDEVPENRRLRSDDYTGVKTLIAEGLRPYARKINEDFADDPEGINDLADGLRSYIEAMTDTDGKYDAVDMGFARNKVVEMMGTDGAALMADLAERLGVGENRAMADKVFAEINEIDRLARSQKSLMDKALSSLQDGQDVNQALLRDEMNAALSWARGEGSQGLSQEQVRFRNSQMERWADERFGTRARAVMRELEKAAAPKSELKDDQKAEVEANPEGEEGVTARMVSDFEEGLSETTGDAQAEVEYRGKGVGRNVLVENPDVARARRPGFESDTEALMKRIETETGGTVRFVSLTEKPELIERIPSEKARVTKYANSLDPQMEAAARDAAIQAFRAERAKQLNAEGKGLLEVTRGKNETRLSDDDVDAIRNRGKTDGKWIFPVGKSEDGNAAVSVDATKLTRLMMDKINEERTWTEGDDQTAITRMARAFSDGITSLMERYGKFKVSPDTVIGYINRQAVTAAQALKADKRTKDDVNSDNKAKAASVVAANLEQASNDLAKALEDGDMEAAARLTQEINQLSKRLDWLNKGRDKDVGRDPRNDIEQLTGNEGVRNDPDAVNDDIVTAAAKFKPKELQTRANMDGSTKGQVSTAAPNAKPLIVMAERIREAGGIGEKLADRIVTLAKNITLMSAADQRRLLALSKASKPSEVGELVNELARKYKDQIMPPKVTPPKAQAAKEEGSPDPKAVAAKKAAFLEKAASGDKALIDELKASTDIKGLQRAAQALAQDGKAPEVLRVINERINELAQDPQQAYNAQTSKYSLEGVDEQPTSGRSMPIEGKKILDYLQKVLGDSVQVEFANLMYAGDFTRTDMADVIRISVHALNPMSTAYHESLHAFFQQLKDKGLPEVVQAVYKGLNSPFVMTQLRERLKNSPEALAQLKDPEERAAYAFQFYMSDPTFKLRSQTRSVFDKIADMIRKALGIWSNDERALAIFDYFASGQYQQQRNSPHAIHTALIRAGRNSLADTAASLVDPLKRLGDAVVGAGGERLRDTGIPALRELADVIKLRGTEEGRDAGYLPAARLQRSEQMNWLATQLKGYKQEHLAEALEAMQQGIKATTTEAKIIQKIAQQKFLRERMFDGYFTKAGVEIGDLGENYFPRVWNAAYISANQEAFIKMLESYGISSPEATMLRIVSGEGNQFEVDKPGFASGNERKLNMISGEDALPFLQKDFWRTMDSYITQATRRGEWARRFGADNGGYNRLLEQAREQGATPEQLSVAQSYVKAVNGTLGDTIDPSFRRLQGNVIAYQNIRLLPLAIFSSVVDPMGIVVRGGTMKDAWQAFARGVKEMRKSWQNDPVFDKATALAEELGTIEDAMLQHTISSLYGQGLMGETAQKVNDLFFRYNFMEGWNRSMRVGATTAAMRFIKRHVEKPNQNSTRYLKELGLSRADVKFDGEGNLEMSEQVKVAINRWVDGAVLKPDAADVPIWMNDPHFALLAHLKRFAFAFHQTFLKRVWHEFQNGNYTPAMAMAGFVPIMMAGDMVKDLATGFGEEPEWKKGWEFSDHMLYAVERAGILGVGQFAVDGLQRGVGSVMGPTVDQLTDAVDVMQGDNQFGEFFLRSMPANALYREAVD